MSDSTTDDGDGRAVNTDDGGDVLEKDLDERAKPAGERLVRGAADSVAALDGAGAARARGAAVSWHGKGGGDRKEARDGGGRNCEKASDGGDLGEGGDHCDKVG